MSVIFTLRDRTLFEAYNSWEDRVSTETSRLDTLEARGTVLRKGRLIRTRDSPSRRWFEGRLQPPSSNCRLECIPCRTNVSDY